MIRSINVRAFLLAVSVFAMASADRASAADAKPEEVLTSTATLLGARLTVVVPTWNPPKSDIVVHITFENLRDTPITYPANAPFEIRLEDGIGRSFKIREDMDPDTPQDAGRCINPHEVIRAEYSLKQLFKDFPNQGRLRLSVARSIFCDHDMAELAVNHILLFIDSSERQ